MRIHIFSHIITSIVRFLASAIVVGLIAGPGLVSATERNMGGRPAGVPANYTVTPFGYFPPECIQNIHEGDYITEDGGIKRTTGAVERRKTCGRDNFTHDGIRVNPNGRTVEGKLARTSHSGALANTQAVKPPAIAHEYLADGSYITSSPIGRIFASWKVPQNPQVKSDQTIYFFPGVQGDTILQPVLGYRGSSNTWDISSWNCCQDGTVQHTDFIPAQSGDQIVGDIYSTCAAGVACDRWNIDTRNMTSGRGVRLTSFPYGNPSLIFGGALEVYDLDSCDEFPADGMLTFSNIAVFDRNMIRVASPPWERNGPATYDLDPQCNYDVRTTSNSVTVIY